MIICDFGCNQQAHYKLKNGKNCCCNSFNKCSCIKKKNSESRKGKPHPSNNPIIKSWKGRKYEEIFGSKQALAMKQKISNAMKKFHPTGKASNEEREQERKRKISEKGKNYFGGYRKGSGRGKKGWYKGFFCDSSWELAFLIYHLDNDIEIQRCKEIRFYEWEGKKTKYYPDFIIDETIYEIKGYNTEQSKEKQRLNPDIKFLFEKDMKLYFDYVISKYGINFIKLYESMEECSRGL